MINNTNIKISGRFAYAENLQLEKMIVFIFETPYNVTGQTVAVIGICDVICVNEIIIGDLLKVVFDDRTILTFEEDIKARQKSKITLHVGEFNGEGILENDYRCNFIFNSNILPGQWQVIYNYSNKGFLANLLGKREILISRLI